MRWQPSYACIDQILLALIGFDRVWGSAGVSAQLRFQRLVGKHESMKGDWRSSPQWQASCLSVHTKVRGFTQFKVIIMIGDTMSEPIHIQSPQHNLAASSPVVRRAPQRTTDFHAITRPKQAPRPSGRPSPRQNTERQSAGREWSRSKLKGQAKFKPSASLSGAKSGPALRIARPPDFRRNARRWRQSCSA